MECRCRNPLLPLIDSMEGVPPPKETVLLSRCYCQQRIASLQEAYPK
jgi:hypothetical protein